jgi:hypothetical protein
MRFVILIFFLLYSLPTAFGQLDSDRYIARTSSGSSVYTGLELKNYFTQNGTISVNGLTDLLTKSDSVVVVRDPTRGGIFLKSSGVTVNGGTVFQGNGCVYQRLFDGFNYKVDWFNRQIAACVNAIPTTQTANVLFGSGVYHSPYTGNIGNGRPAASANRMNRSNLSFIAPQSGWPNTDSTELIGGTVVKGGWIFYGDNLSFTKIGFDAGAIWCNAYNSGVATEGICKIANTATLGDVKSTNINLSYCVSLCKADNSNTHAIYFEGVNGGSVDHCLAINGGSGIVVKGSNIWITDTESDNHESYAFLTKADDFIGISDYVYFTNCLAKGRRLNATTFKGQGFRIFNDSQHCENIFFTNCNGKNLISGFEFQAINGFKITATINGGKIDSCNYGFNDSHLGTTKVSNLHINVADYGALIYSNSDVQISNSSFLNTVSTAVGNYGKLELIGRVTTKSLLGYGIYANSGTIKLGGWQDLGSTQKIGYGAATILDYQSNVPTVSTLEIAQIVPKNGDLFNITNTNSTFTEVGLWGFENNAWVKFSTKVVKAPAKAVVYGTGGGVEGSFGWTYDSVYKTTNRYVAMGGVFTENFYGQWGNMPLASVEVTNNVSYNNSGKFTWSTTRNGTFTPIRSMVLESSGFLGLGIMNPTNQLHVFSSANPVRFEGLQTTNNATNTLLTYNATGVLEGRSVANFMAAIPISTLQQVSAAGNTTTLGLNADYLSGRYVGNATATNIIYFNSTYLSQSGLNVHIAPKGHVLRGTDNILRLDDTDRGVSTNIYTAADFYSVNFGGSRPMTNSEYVFGSSRGEIVTKLANKRVDFQKGVNGRDNYVYTSSAANQFFSSQQISDTARIVTITDNGTNQGTGVATLILPQNPQNNVEFEVNIIGAFGSVIVTATAAGQNILISTGNVSTTTFSGNRAGKLVCRFLSDTQGSIGGLWIIKLI